MPSALFFKARQFTLRWRSGSRPENQRLLPGVSAQMFEDPFDDHRIFNTGNDLHPPTTVPAGLYVDPEYALQTLSPCHSGMALRCCLDRLCATVPGAAARSQP